MHYKPRKCVECGKEFIPKSGTNVYCPGPHVSTCEYCGKQFEYTTSPKFKRKYCSASCRELAKKQNLMKKYGVDNVAKIPEVAKTISNVKSGKQPKTEYASVVTYRKCEYCGKEFRSNGTQKFCDGPHYGICEWCGKSFKVDPHKPNRFCSSECSYQYRTSRMDTKVCEWCGKEFHPKVDAQKYCDGPHYSKCLVCGKVMQVPKGQEYSYPRTCSVECATQLRQRTCRSKYGVDVVSQSDVAREKLRQKALNNVESHKEYCQTIYGYNNSSKHPKVRQKIKESVLSENCQTRTAEVMMNKYGVRYAMQNPQLFKKQAQSRGNHHAADGTHVDSSWEQLVYDFALRNGLSLEYQVPVRYKVDGTSHTTYIDFKIDGVLFEVKSPHLLKGVFDYKGVPISAKLEVYKKNHVVVITDKDASDMFGKPNSTESNGFKYENKCPNPLIGVDIELFKPNPDFPYREDRPHCFYDVRVDGQKSSCEAFYDESIRWKMIMNRIQYSGGFIDGKQVLNALNITRTCKQPSWFSRTLAREILSKYSTSDTIVDCFAGWGAREQATHDLKKWYVGIDLNPDLVEWHHEQGRGDIALGDARTFKYDKECTIFICPPYSDPKTGRCFEDYNFDGFTERAKALTQCEWLKIVMNNCPNFKEAIMVCKIVDPGWEQYIVDTKKNKSHFGVNNEYVLVVSGHR